MDWLNENSGAVQAIATLVLVGVTAAYVWLTRGIADAARRSASETADLVSSSRRQAGASEVLVLEARRSRSLDVLPLVVAEMAGASTPNILGVRLQNRGVGTAIDVKVRWRLSDAGGEYEAILPALAPGEDLKRNLALPDPDVANRIIRQNERPAFDSTYGDVLGAEYLSSTTQHEVTVIGTNEAGRFTLGSP